MGEADDDRKAILARRNRLIAIALSGITSAGAAGCYDEHRGDEDAAVEEDAGIPVPCLSPPLEDAGSPVPCLSRPLDAGPAPCLDAPLPEDAGTSGGGDAGAPIPCLSPPAE